MAVRIESHAEPIPGYRLIERLGGGGFGEVWKCEAPGGLLKAVKFVYGDLDQLGEEGHRAEQELKALSRVKTVRHPYILSLERFDVIDGQLIIIMELADKNLWDRFKECRAQGLPGIPRDELLGYLEETAEALDLMNNTYQLQHLDIKPQNLFLVYQHVKVADFGLVKDLEGMQASVTGGVTPVYAAPETFDGWVSRYSDQYSLAIVFQELLTGQRPFSGNNVRQLVMQHLKNPPNLDSLSEGDRPAVERALAKNPELRFHTCADFVRALRRAGAAGPRPRAYDEAGHDTDRGGPRTTPQEPVAVQEAPGLADPSSGTTQSLRAHDGFVLRPPEPAATPPEVRGDGELFPALVVAVGQVGLQVMQHLRRSLHERFGSGTALPNLRQLLLDTDPEVLRAATRGTGTALTAGEVLLAPLNRPGHYLKPRDGRLPVGSWCNPKMVYRIPRAQVTLGARILGRLAFFDNYRAIVRRLRAELAACLDPAVLTAAGQRTGLTTRTNRPRVYVVAGVAGGTGGGMFLDLAYTVRYLLRQLGYAQPDVVGLLLAPAGDGKGKAGPAEGAGGKNPGPARNAARTLGLGNAHAAFTELLHFASPRHVFAARYHEAEPAVVDAEPPFGRTVVLPLPPESDEAAGQEATGLAAEFLCRDLCSPLGRVADLARADLPTPVWAERGLYYHTFGLHYLASPHRPLVREVGRALCFRLAQRWLSKDSAPVRETVSGWIGERWQAEQWDPESVDSRFRSSAERLAGGNLDEAVAQILAPLKLSLQVDPKEKNPRPKELDRNLFKEAADALDALVGPPPEEEVMGQVSLLPPTLKEESDGLVAEWGQRVAELVVRLIEEPEFRLVGAEEAVRQLVVRVEGVLRELEPRAQEHAKLAFQAFAGIKGVLANLQKPPGRGRRPLDPFDAVGLLHGYAEFRFEALVRQQVINAYVALRGHLSDQLREINFCRVRLGELAQHFADPADVPAPASGRPGTSTVRGTASATGGTPPHSRRARPSEPAAAGRRLFPAGCRTLAEAVQQFLGGFSPEDLVELDYQAQEVIRRQFQALVNVCLTSANVLREVEDALRQCAEEFVGPKLAATNAAELFLGQYPSEEEAVGEVHSVFDEAAAEPVGRSAGRAQPELNVLLTPPGPAGERFAAMTRDALEVREMTGAAAGDDVVVYREQLNLALAELDVFGPAGKEAYRLLCALECFTPHTRTDVAFVPAPCADKVTT
jgi:hypothetical protein